MTDTPKKPPKDSGVDPDTQDSDRTILMPMPADKDGAPETQATAEGADESTTPPATQPPAHADDTDASTAAPTTQPPQDDDDDRTLLFQAVAQDPPDQTAPEDDQDDGDRTLLMPMPGADAPAEDADRTILSLAPQSGDAPGTDAPADQGSTYRPFSEGTSAPVSPPPEDDLTMVTGTLGGLAQPPSQTEGVSGAAPLQTPATPSPMRTLEPGSVINNMYRVEERLDHGGMGSVFRGVEIGTGESVAIKVILPEMAEDPRVAQMFRREARTLRQLHHDAIVRYFAYVPPDANFNLHALVMGFIEGTKLSDKIKTDGALTEDQVCKLFLRLAGGLDRAHKIGVVHRDLSPDNVMLPGNDIMKALLIDFGISRSSKVKDVTIGNEFAGKLKYVSPEQLGAFGGEAEAQSDVYSFGLLMIVALTGQALPMGDSIVEAVQRRQSVPDLTEVPSNFQTLLYQMLQPDPAQRMQSMEAVIGDLKRIQGGDAVTLSGSTKTQNTRVVRGLQAAPQANPVGEGFVTTAPTEFPKAEMETSGGFGKIFGLLAVLAVVGGGAWFALGQPGLNVGDDTDTAAAADDGLTRVAGSRATVLAESLSEPCGYATLRANGPNAGLIEGFATNPAVLAPVGPAFSEAFGMEPDMVTYSIGAEQCAALDLARTFQGTSGAAVELTLDATKVARTDGVVGTIYDDSANRQGWLALIAPTGQVFSLMSQLGDPIGGQRSFSFRLPSAQPGTYVLITTASKDALVRAGAMANGTKASALLPLMIRELAEDGQGAVTVGAVEITQ